MFSNKLISKLLILIVLSIPFSTLFATDLDLTSAAKDVAKEIGKVGKVLEGNALNPVFVIEEYHTSRVGQIQISIMLNRLYTKYGVRHIGLEGFTKIGKVLDVNWFKEAGGTSAKQAREDVAVRMLAEGEINAAEFMALTYQDFSVFGVEKQSEYDVKLDVKTSPRIMYLMFIAEKSLSQNQILEVSNLAQQKKDKDVIEYLLNSDPWVKSKYQEIINPSSLSIEFTVNQIQELQDKAKSLGVQVDSQIERDMQKTLHFFETASRRSETMINALSMVSKGSSPVVLIIGAAHTDRVLTELSSRKIGYALLTPNALNPEKGGMEMEQFERKNNHQWARIKPGTLGKILNRHRKPPPILETRTAHSYASMNLASILIAEAAGLGKSVPDDIWVQLKQLPDIKIDKDSFSRDGDDVIFRAYLINTQNKETEVWARVGILNTKKGASMKKYNLEQKLLQAAADLSEEPVTNPHGGGKIPPQDPPPGSKRTSNEGPGDGKRGNFLVSKLNRRSIAVYTKGKDEAIKVGRISG